MSHILDVEHKQHKHTELTEWQIDCESTKCVISCFRNDCYLNHVHHFINMHVTKSQVHDHWESMLILIALICFD